MSKCNNKKCGCYDNKYPFICVNNQDIPGCEDRKLIASNTTHPQGYEGVTIITPEVNQISAYKEHLEFVNSTEPLSGIKKHVVLRIAQSFIDGITGLISNFLGRNLGDGAKVYKGPVIEGQNVIHEFKTIKTSGSITIYEDEQVIVPAVNEIWLQDQFPDPPVVNYPVIHGNNIGNGIPIFKGLNDKKLDIATLTSALRATFGT